MNPEAQIRVGPAGWSYKDWDGVFYPPGMQHRREHPLEYVARCFDVCEINTSLQDHIRPEIAKLWAKRVAAINPDFVFTAKLHRSFTHSPIAVMEPTSAATIRPNDEDERLARAGLDALAGIGKLAALLIQFPASYKNTSLNREYLEILLRQFIEFPRVVEVQHASWNNPETISYFAERGVSFCNIEQPLTGSSRDAVEHVTAPAGYVRLQGDNYDQWFEPEGNNRYNHLYSEAELMGWKEKIERSAEKNVTTYVITNNHFEAKACVNALQMKNILTGRRVKAPEVLLEHYPGLKKIADPLDDVAGLLRA